MGWVHVEERPGMGLEEQHLLQWHGVTVCALRPTRSGGLWWRADLLNPGRDGSSPLTMTGFGLDEARAECEHVLVNLGWERPA